MEHVPPPPSKSPGTVRELRHYLHLLRKRWRVMTAVLIAGGAIAFVYTMRQPRIYEATCSLVIEPTAPRVLEGVRDVVQLGAEAFSYTYYQTQYRIIKSREIAQRVLDRVGPSPSQTDGNAAKPTRQKQVDMLLGQVKVAGVRDSSIANITVRDRDPERAGRIANAFAEAYVERNLDFKLEGARSASSWLGEQTVDLRKKLEDSELALYRYRKEHNLLDLGLDDRQGMTRQNLATLNERLADIKAKRIEAEAIRKLIVAAKNDVSEKESLPEIRDNAIVTKLRENYLDLLKMKADLESRYGEKHPKIENVLQQIQATRRDYNRELDEVLKAFDKKYRAIVDTEVALTKWMNQEKAQALDLAKLEVEYRPMARDAENNAKVFGQVTQRQKEVDLTGLQRTNNARVLDRAMGPGKQVSPNLRNNLVVGFVLGLLAGLLLAFVIEALDNTVKTPEAAEELVGAPLLGVLPVLSNAKAQSIDDAADRDLTVHKEPTSAAAEACRSIRTNLMFLSAQKVVQVFVVTSPGPRDGKTTAAISLAITMAQAGARVLLVDTDLRKPRIHRSFGLKADQGISTAIMGEAGIEELIVHTEIPNLDVLPCGPTPPNPAELLHTDRFRAILDQCRQGYDKVILDSPPTGPVTDPAIIGSISDGVLLILRAGHTTRESATHARRHLTDAGARILGLVINQTDRKGAGYGYGYSYYSSYGRYYRTA
ncbi:MAG: polysaccharide biosynthesis tyrosine autokinase [Deltaproteobacteria bacterium]|nr:polysaccharide biosynthesis tyrosine autokinase [Deltaproteobacteria bacterium]